MTKLNKAQFVAKTDPGLIRKNNEDAIAISPLYGLAILADGMGGHNAGEVASAIAVSVTRQALENCLQNMMQNDSQSPSVSILKETIQEAIELANTTIIQAAQKGSQYRGMGTTLVLALLHADKITIAHVGDSRAYRFRRNQLLQLTRDHSLLQEQIDAGLLNAEAAPFSRNKNILTRAVGIDYLFKVEMHEHQTEPGDLYLLCSDGLSDMLTASEIRDILARLGSNLDFASSVLINSANGNGGHDNVSVILIKIGTDNSP
jgi:PPM family protein phosphatase